MSQKGLLIALIVAGFVGVSLLLEGSSESTPAAVATIDRDELRSALRFLASDELGGRDTGSRGNRIAADYLAHRLELMGLEPAGDDGSYFQSVGLAKAGLSGSNRLEIRRADSATSAPAILLKDFYPSPLSASGRADGPVLFAGYGITAPEFDYDDYAGIDASGSIVLVLVGEPGPSDPDSPFLGEITTEYGRPFHKIINAQNHGASAVLVARTRPGRGFARAARSAWPESIEDSRYQLAAWSEQTQIPVAYVSAEVARRIAGEFSLTQAGERIDRSFLPASRLLDESTVSLETGIVRSLSSVPNVLARMPGRDPEVAAETVIVSAHFDHVGTRGEDVYNGADDDGSGTVAVLEVAQAFSLSDQRPRRSVVFALWNAEERGLLGSRYYVAQPPAKRTAAIYQLDMVGRNEEIPDGNSRRFRGLQTQTAAENSNSLHVVGYSFNDQMRRLVVSQNSNTQLDLKFDLDTHPISLLTRSDHWPFLVAGIPAIFFTSGLHPDYHRPSDTADKINYPKLERVARLAFLCAWQSANAESGTPLDSREKRP